MRRMYLSSAKMSSTVLRNVHMLVSLSTLKVLLIARTVRKSRENELPFSLAFKILYSRSCSIACLVCSA